MQRNTATHKLNDPFETSANQRRYARGGSRSRDLVTFNKNDTIAWSKCDSLKIEKARTLM